MALSFPRSTQFAFDKRADDPCRNLLADFGCGIHSSLRSEGFGGCTQYTCYGAGQKVAQVIYAGRDWRQWPATAEPMFRVFRSMRMLHEALWFLAEGIERSPDGPGREELIEAFEHIERLTLAEAEEVEGLASDACIATFDLLGKASGSIRSSKRAVPVAGLKGALRMGADLRGADLAHADLRGAVLVGSDLSGADLRGADFLRADLRATKLNGADLTDALFLTQGQLDEAEGDTSTVVPGLLTMPAHWVT